MPMTKNYSNGAQRSNLAQSMTASAALVQQLLNYSKSLETKKLKLSNVLVHLN